MYFQRLKDLRDDKELSQEQIGQLLNIKQTVYSRYERGFQTIPVEHLITLADFYDTSTDYILGRTNDISPCQKKSDSIHNLNQVTFYYISTGSSNLRHRLLHRFFGVPKINLFFI